MAMMVETERLLIRTPHIEDLDALHARRNDPQVAQFQSWSVPFPRAQSEQIVRGAADMGRPAEDEWWMATVVKKAGNEIIGDLAVHLTFRGLSAEIGYTFAAAHWGQGYAGEAVRALLRYLFIELQVRRISGVIHPDNVPSAQVLERAGMVFEGRTKSSFWADRGSSLARESSDDVLYGFTLEDWEAWQSRPLDPPADVRLGLITPDTQRMVSRLATHKSQERFVAPVPVSFGDVLFPAALNGVPVVREMRVVEADGTPAGFMLLATTTGQSPEPHVERFLIDRLHQGRGIGGRALELLEQTWRDEGHRSLTLGWTEGRGSPGPFYLSRGYRPTGEVVDGDIEARKVLR